MEEWKRGEKMWVVGRKENNCIRKKEPCGRVGKSWKIEEESNGEEFETVGTPGRV